MIFRSIWMLCLLAALAMLACAGTAHAARSYDNCVGFITTVPATISAPGTWCLSQDVTTSMATGAAITIASDDVILDCNDFRVDDSTAGTATTAVGVFAQSRLRATIRHCSILGFKYGVELQIPGISGDGRHLVEYNHIDGSTFIGIYVNGDNSVIRNNVVHNTGNYSAPPLQAEGIHVSGQTEINDNFVAGVNTSGGSGEIGYGIRVESSSFATVWNNHVADVLPSTSGTAYGIYLNSVSRAAIRQNRLSQYVRGANHAFFCSSTSDRASRNITLNFADSSLGGCGDAGNNSLNP